MLRVSAVRKTFGERLALDGVSFEVRPGEVFGLLGPNGAGKTTLVRILIGMERPDAGEVEIAGATDPTRSAVRRRIGIAAQSVALYGELTARENLMFAGRLYGLRGAALRERASACLALVDLESRANDRVETLSGGMKRRLDVACALVHDPPVVLFDEPTAGLDLEGRDRLLATIERLAHGGRTVLMTTHVLAEADRVCDRIGILSRGRLLAAGTAASIARGHGDLERAFIHYVGIRPEPSCEPSWS